MTDTAEKPGPRPADASLSPAMRQYQQFKSQYPDYVLFFRMGDFYEMFWDDARTAARVLGVTLTSRSRGGLDAEDAIPMAGVPFHAVDNYLRRMIAAGYRVAICEQMEDASLAKGVVKREVTRLMTPGTLTDDPLLDGRTDNYLAAVAFGVTRGSGYRAALAWIELSTGAVRALSGTEQQLLDEAARLSPAELLVPELPSGQPHSIVEPMKQRGVKSITTRPGWQFTPHHAAEQVRKQWAVRTTQGFGFADDDPANAALAAVLSYLEETQKTTLAHLRTPQRHVVEDHVAIDPSSYRSLEIDRTVRSGSAEGSLLSAIDRTRTAMGARLLRQWVRFPLTDVEHITARQNAIAALLESGGGLKAIVSAMTDICDIERIVARVTVARASPRDLWALGRCLGSLPALVGQIEQLPARDVLLPELARHLPAAQQVAAYLASAILPDPPAHLREGGVIAGGFDAELDRLRDIGTNSQQWLAAYQSQLIGQSRIPSLKVGYNKVFGYYIEVTDAHREKVPTDWIRKQTVKNAERYITPELKTFESEALGARDKSVALEQQLYEQVRQALLPHVPTLQELALAIAQLDVLCGFAALAADRRYCRPDVVEQRVLKIVDGRHPVLEQQLGASFVANDVHFDAADSLLLITGPNMAGKSTFIRQVALITLLAQVGSFVPARSATVGVVDRLFTRIGASDELHAGQSTFMVEMTETANLLNNATDRSLVILDEIGRGTSTLDGLSLAWAIAEHVASDLKCRTLFATHYHELTDLAARFTGVRNANVAVREWEDQVVFLHRIVEGGTDRSYGIHVARLAGVPKPILERARQLLGELAVQHVGRPRISRSRKSDRVADDNQLSLFVDPAVELRQSLQKLQVDQLSPMQAFELLREWKQKYGGS
jgi:DNA mismatch repair protein MutS